MTLPVVKLVGVGALGSYAALFLRGTAELHLLDPDRVESKNVATQFHARQAIGRTKVVGLRDTLSLLFNVQPRPTVYPVRVGPGNAEGLLAGADLVMVCVDHGPSRRAVVEAARGLSIPCLHAGISERAETGRVGWDDYPISDAPEGAETCEDGEFVPAVAQVAAHAAVAAWEFLRTGRRISSIVLPTKIIDLGV